MQIAQGRYAGRDGGGFVGEEDAAGNVAAGGYARSAVGQSSRP